MRKLSHEKTVSPLGALRAFHAVARCRSFKRAADMLGVSATAVSHQIKLLESVLECRVCERNALASALPKAAKFSMPEPSAPLARWKRLPRKLFAHTSRRRSPSPPPPTF